MFHAATAQEMMPVFGLFLYFPHQLRVLQTHSLFLALSSIVFTAFSGQSKNVHFLPMPSKDFPMCVFVSPPSVLSQFLPSLQMKGGVSVGRHFAKNPISDIRSPPRTKNSPPSANWPLSPIIDPPSGETKSPWISEFWRRQHLVAASSS